MGSDPPAIAHYLYLTAILAGLSGVLLVRRRFDGELGGRLISTIAVTVALFLCFDLVGSARGWFYSNPHLNALIVSPGIPVEEPLLLAFLTVLSITIWECMRRLLP